MEFSVAVQTCAGREIALGRTCAELEASDVGSAYTVFDHPPGKTVVEHCLGVLDALSKAGTEYAIRLEDDVLVNANILHNLRTWPALGEPDFGAGWLYVPRCLLLDLARTGYGRKTRSAHRITDPRLGGSLGVLFRTGDLPAVIEQMRSHAGLVQDWSMSRAVFELGKRVYYAKPSLLEHNVDVPSSLEHSAKHHGIYHTSGGYFQRAWKRGSSKARPTFGP